MAVWVDVFIDFVFITDIGINFRSAYLTETGELVLNTRTIATKYLSGWFMIDFSSSIPIDLILFIVEEASGTGGEGGSSFKLAKLLKGLRLVRLMKLLRLLKITKYLKNLQEEVQINPAIIELCTLGVQTVFLVHLAGCLWHWTAILSLPDEEPERSQAALKPRLHCRCIAVTLP